MIQCRERAFSSNKKYIRVHFDHFSSSPILRRWDVRMQPWAWHSQVKTESKVCTWLTKTHTHSLSIMTVETAKLYKSSSKLIYHMQRSENNFLSFSLQYLAIYLRLYVVSFITLFCPFAMAKPELSRALNAYGSWYMIFYFLRRLTVTYYYSYKIYVCNMHERFGVDYHLPEINSISHKNPLFLSCYMWASEMRILLLLRAHHLEIYTRER